MGACINFMKAGSVRLFLLKLESHYQANNFTHLVRFWAIIFSVW